MRHLLVVPFLLCAGLVVAGESEDLEAGRVLFGTCAACHLPTGAGVPGAFPPLKNRLAKIASTLAGRAYLIHVLLKGINGPMRVDGVLYQGYMQGYQSTLGDEQISALLNYMVTQLNDTKPVGFAWFSAAEIAGVRAALALATTTSLEKRNQLELD